MVASHKFYFEKRGFVVTVTNLRGVLLVFNVVWGARGRMYTTSHSFNELNND